MYDDLVPFFSEPVIAHYRYIKMYWCIDIDIWKLINVFPTRTKWPKENQFYQRSRKVLKKKQKNVSAPTSQKTIAPRPTLRQYWRVCFVCSYPNMVSTNIQSPAMTITDGRNVIPRSGGRDDMMTDIRSTAQSMMRIILHIWDIWNCYILSWYWIWLVKENQFYFKRKLVLSEKLSLTRYLVSLKKKYCPAPQILVMPHPVLITISMSVQH